MRMTLFLSIALYASTAISAECEWKESFVSPDAVALAPEKFDAVTPTTSIEAAVEIVGPAARDVGSGMYVLQWKVADGRVFSVSAASVCSNPMAIGFQPKDRAESGDTIFLYFNDLAQGVLAGKTESFRRVLSKAASTPPGEQLEELAEISSRFIRLAPEAFLREQAATDRCFGVRYLGAAYVDEPEARSYELSLRREALNQVRDPKLAEIKQHCLDLLSED